MLQASIASPRAPGNGPGWTDARIERLKALWAEGRSASEIAGLLGEVTRNAVIGKVHRLGLAGRKTTSRQPVPRRTSPRRDRSGRVELRLPPSRFVRSASPLPPAPPPPVAALMLPLRQLRDDQCRWPVGDEEDLFVQAAASACLVYDNLSSIAEWLSDALCTIATGASYTKRQLHTDSDEIILTVTRPVLLTSVAEVVTRTDLASRAVIVNLAVIKDSKRMTEREFNAALEKARPRILGALLDAASHGLATMPKLHLDNLPRMADALKWAHACEGKWWQPGKIIDAYMGCADDAVDAVLESDPALVALRAFMAKQGFYMSDDGDQTEFRYWRGSGDALLDALSGFAPEGALRNKQCPWPADATRLSGRLSMAGPALRQRGITVEKGREHGGNRARWIEIKALDTFDGDAEAA
jgi:hypothetical protein